jgi:integrase
MGRWGTGTVRRLASGRFQARLTLAGRKVSLGTFATRREATAALARATATGKTRSTGRTAVSNWAERWWETRVGHRPTTRHRDRQVLDNEILPALGVRQLAQLTTADVQEWVNQLAARVAPATVRRCYTILAQLLDAAVDAGLLAVAPTGRVRLPRRVRYEARFLTAAELERLADTIREPWRAMVLVTAYATLRIGEAAGLRRADVDLAAGTVRVANNLVWVRGQPIEGPPKTASGRRTMTMPASVMAELAEHLDGHADPTHVFTAAEGGLLRPEDWRKHVWAPAVRQADLAPLRVHDLKHTGVALLAAAGVDPKEVSRRAGHASVAFTYDRYGHLFPEADRAAAAKLDGLRARALDHQSGTEVARPAGSPDRPPRLYVPGLPQGSLLRGSEGAVTTHTGCTRCRPLPFSAPGAAARDGRSRPLSRFPSPC